MRDDERRAGRDSAHSPALDPDLPSVNDAHIFQTHAAGFFQICLNNLLHFLRLHRVQVKDASDGNADRFFFRLHRACGSILA